MTPNKPFSEKDIATATAGAEVFYWKEAGDAVATTQEEMPLADLINLYCADCDVGRKLVHEYIAGLPCHSDTILNAFIRFEVLRSTRDALAKILGVEKELKEEAERGKAEPTIDNDGIRHSAGYNEKQDDEVADSSKTDRAQEFNITDNEIGKSAAEDVSYVDRTANVSPALTFMFATRDLARGICDHCLENGDVLLLDRAGVISEHPHNIAQQIVRLAGKLQPPQEEDL